MAADAGAGGVAGPPRGRAPPPPRAPLVDGDAPGEPLGDPLGTVPLGAGPLGTDGVGIAPGEMPLGVGDGTSPEGNRGDSTPGLGAWSTPDGTGAWIPG